MRGWVMISTAGKLSSMRSEKTGELSITVKLKSALDLLSSITDWFSTRSTLNMIRGITRFSGILERSSVRLSRASSTAWELPERSYRRSISRTYQLILCKWSTNSKQLSVSISSGLRKWRNSIAQTSFSRGRGINTQLIGYNSTRL